MLNILGEALLASSQPEDARTQHASALALASQIGDHDQLARAHHGLGHACLAVGDPAQARRHWQQALTLYTRLGVPEADEVRAILRHLHPAPRSRHLHDLRGQMRVLPAVTNEAPDDQPQENS